MCTCKDKKRRLKTGQRVTCIYCHPSNKGRQTDMKKKTSWWRKLLKK